MMNNTATLLKGIQCFTLLSMVAITGCSTRTNSPSLSTGNVGYGDSKEVETLTNEFGLTDLHILAESMTGSLLTSPLMSSNSKPTFTIQEVKNKTSEYIDTKAITNKIRVKLQKSNAVRFMSDAEDEVGALSEIQRQGQSPRYKKTPKNQKLGKAEGASYRLFGEITSIVKRAGDIMNVDYTLTLQVEDLATSEIVWTDEKEIRKTSERSMF